MRRQLSGQRGSHVPLLDSCILSASSLPLLSAFVARRLLHCKWSACLAGPTSPAIYVTKADFDQAFTDAAVGHRDFKPADVEKLRKAALRSSDAR